MLALLVALSLTARPAPSPKPIAPKQADFVLYLKSPRTGLPDLRAFLERAGTYAPSLRPASLGLSLGDLLGADALDAEALEEAGANVDAPLTLSFMGQGTLLCLEKKSAEIEKRIDAKLAGAGQRVTRKHLGARLVGAATGTTWRLGYATKGARICTASGARDAQGLLESAAAGMGKAGIASLPAFRNATRSLEGPVIGFVNAGDASAGFALTPSEKSLGARGLAVFDRSLLAEPRDGDPLAKAKVPAALNLYASFSKKALARPGGPAAAALRFLVHHTCRACGEDAPQQLLAALSPHLFGSMVLVVPRIDPSAAGSALPRYFLFPHAYLLSLKDPAAAAAALKAFATRLEDTGAKVAEEANLGEGLHLSTRIGDRPVFVGVAGKVLYLSNERSTRDMSLAGLKQATPGKAAHAVIARLDGPLASAALRRISILDAPKSPDLAALFALGVEAGALLKAAGEIGGHAEPETKGARFELGFNISK